MEIKNDFEIENIRRMTQIAEVYEITKQHDKSEKYHKIIIRICEKYPKNERMLAFKIHSLNSLKKPFKALETTNELLNLNPYNMAALLNLADYLVSD